VPVPIFFTAVTFRRRTHPSRRLLLLGRAGDGPLVRLIDLHRDIGHEAFLVVNEPYASGLEML
jgi:hypothetical protein